MADDRVGAVIVIVIVCAVPPVNCAGFGEKEQLTAAFPHDNEILPENPDVPLRVAVTVALPPFATVIADLLSDPLKSATVKGNLDVCVDPEKVDVRLS